MAAVSFPLAGALSRGLNTTRRWPVAAGGGADPHFANVVSLMHFDGTVGAAGLTDEKGVTWTPHGTAPALTDAQKQFGPTSLLMGVDSYISATPAVALGTGDFTLEGWFYEQGNRAFMQIGPLLLYQSGGFYYLWNGSTNIMSIAGSNNNSWVYAAMRRTFIDGPGLAIQVYINDSLIDTLGYSSDLGTPELRLGWFNAGNPSPLYIDEFRATYGVARTITARPTAEFPDS